MRKNPLLIAECGNESEWCETLYANLPVAQCIMGVTSLFNTSINTHKVLI